MVILGGSGWGVTAKMNVNQFSGPPPAMEASPSKRLFSRCVASWKERGSPKPEATVRQSSPAESIEQKFLVADEASESQELADAHSSAPSCAFAAGIDVRASSQSSGGRARSEEMDSSSVCAASGRHPLLPQVIIR